MAIIIYSMKYFLVFIVFLPIICSAQIKSIGLPDIQNYPKAVYMAGTQNWGIAQDKKGFIYFANNDGVLYFDGVRWELSEFSKSSPIRSILADEKGRIYVGLINDFGFLEMEESGKPGFHSLRQLLPPEIDNFLDIWRIHETSHGIVFQSYDFAFIYINNTINVIKPVNRFQFSFHVHRRLFFHEPGVGLFEYINGNTEQVYWADLIISEEIRTILPYGNNGYLIGTESKGFFIYENGALSKWNSPVNYMVEKDKLFCGTTLTGNYYAFGTILNGLIISDDKGQIIQHINRNKGLQNNTVLSAYADKDKNLWLGLDNGIDYIKINSPLSFISDIEGLGTGYASIVHNQKLYLGTNQGLFVKPLDNLSGADVHFELIENTAGQVWSLDIFNGQLICGHNAGTFLIENDQAIQISTEPGAWKFIRLRNYPDLLLGGCYNGLLLLQMSNNGWKELRKIKGFTKSSRFLLEDENSTIWISHGGEGIYKLKLNQDLDSIINVRLYNELDGLPSKELNILVEFAGNEYVSTVEGVFEYENISDKFIASERLNLYFKDGGRLKTVKTDSTGNVWYISQYESGVLRVNEDLSYTKIAAPFLPLTGRFVNEFEFIYPHNNENVLFGIDNGFAHYSSHFSKSYTETYSAYLTKVEIFNIQQTDYPLSVEKVHMKIPFRRNAMRFHFAAPFFEIPEKNLFSYSIENYTDGWSDWTPEIYKDFTNLHEGEYTFRLKAKNIYGYESDIAAYQFTILPPWHRSKFAYFMYLILTFLSGVGAFRYARHRIDLSKKRDRLKYQLEMKKREEELLLQKLIAEREVELLRNEKLSNEMIHRDKELANQTMNIIQKNKLLMKLKDELLSISKSAEGQQVKSKLATIGKRLDKEIDSKQQNIIFETYFDEVHEAFFKKLKLKFQGITTKEMRLCAYIKMNLTSKEIAALLNISDRGVEISRYRLRKKLDLQRDINMSEYLNSI